ncbi:EPT/RTPC-like protein [Delitschia confertaspora ATCC 74209]|uniref:EPT/RTPC-like protein n=1 Tax=Delitschia confertaspora ATCC 74209 TaxID=1513339 RepID=A0A9P4JQD0_9PLEO|nr:EPT/RTPC-like protein [Delitschia confertaspora ATCC 74209]
MTSPIHLEGTTLEGGGQLLRIAIGISSLTNVPVRITNIRGNRSGGGGLKPQHLASVQWLANASKARLSGMGLKSKDLTFVPDSTRSFGSGWDYQTHHLPDDTFVHEFQIRQNTVGSIGLVFQAILPWILFCGCCLSSDVKHPYCLRIRIMGGTNVSNSPSYDQITQVLLPMLSLIGIPNITAELDSRGWSNFVKGSRRLGSISFTVPPLDRYTSLPAFNLKDRGEIEQIQATVLAPKHHESHVRQELESELTNNHMAIFGTRAPIIKTHFEDSGHDKRFYLLLVATTTTGIKLGRDWLYDHKININQIDTVISQLVKQVTAKLITEIDHGGCVDEYMRDQLVVFQALAKGKSSVYNGRKKDGTLVEPSLHAKTAQWVANALLGVMFDEEGGCEGVGYVPS